MSNLRTTEDIIQKNLECYNNRDLSGFMATFRDDIALYTFPDPEPAIEGIDAIRKFYKGLFDASPKLHATILKRITFDNKVIDHESIVGRMGVEAPLEIVVIYEVEDGKICRLTAIRKREA